MAELCIGTVQFGMRYGINNKYGQPEADQCFEMLDIAARNKVHFIDTARAYGTAELVLGEYFRVKKNSGQFKLISKLRPNIIDENEKDICGTVRRECENTLSRLGIECLDGYLCHTPEYVHRSDILHALKQLKEQKLVSNIGISIYSLKEGYAALEKNLDYIQLPYNIFDQRGMQQGFIRQAKQAGITVFARSPFLQGLLLMEKERVPEYLKHAVPHLERFEQIADKYHIDKAEALLRFVSGEQDIDFMVFGVDTKEQLIHNIDSAKKGVLPNELIQELKDCFAQIEEGIIIPSLWSNGRRAE